MMATNTRYKYTILLVFSTFLTYAQIPESKLSNIKIPLDSTVRYGKLDNGFRYYLKSNNHPEEEVVLKLIVKAGVYHQDKDQAEYAHLLEHIATRDVKGYDDLDIVFKLNNISRRAFTNRVATSYTLYLANCDEQKLNLGIDILEKWASGIKIDSARLDIHKGTILGELRSNDAYAEDLHDKKGDIILRNTTFPIEKATKSIQGMNSLKIERLKDFYKDWYRPDLQEVIAVGSFDVDSLENIIINKFSKLKIPSKVRDPSQALAKFNFRLTGENQYESVTDSLNRSYRLEIFTKTINYDFRYRTEKEYYLKVLQNLYEYIITRRKNEFLNQYAPPFADYSTNYYANSLANELLSIRLLSIPLDDDLSRIEKEIFKAVKADQIIHSNFTIQEFIEAKEAITSKIKISVHSSRDLAKVLEHHVTYKKAAPANETLSKLKSLIDDISISEVQEFANSRKNLLENSDFIFINVPDNSIPRNKEIEKIIAKAYNSSISEYQSPLKSIDKIKDILVEKDRLEMDIVENAIGVTTVTMGNNIQILLKPTTPETPDFINRIEVLGFQPLRYDDDLKCYNDQILAHNYASNVGTTFHNYFEIQAFKRDQRMRMNFGMDEENFLIEGSFDRKNLDDFFNLLVQHIEHPELSLQAFDYWKRTMKKRVSPYGVKGGSDFFREKIEKSWNPKYPYVSENLLNKIDQQSMSNAYKIHFSNFDEYTFIITGDFESSILLEEIAPYISRLPVTGRREGEKISRWRKRLEKRTDTLLYPGVQQSFSEIFLPVKISSTIKNQVVLDLVNTAFYERLIEILRLDCYGPAAGGEWVDLDDSLYTFQLRFNNTIGKEEYIFQNSMKEIDVLKKQGVDQEWLESNIRYASDRFSARISSFGYFNFWPKFLKNSLGQDRDYEEYILKYPDIIENSVTLKDVNSAIRNYITKENLQYFLVLPE